MAKRGRGSRRSTLDTTRILPSVCLFFFFFFLFFSFFLFDFDSFISLFSSFLSLSFFSFFPSLFLLRRLYYLVEPIFSHDSTRFLTGFLTKISNYSRRFVLGRAWFQFSPLSRQNFYTRGTCRNVQLSESSRNVRGTISKIVGNEARSSPASKLSTSKPGIKYFSLRFGKSWRVSRMDIFLL